MENAIITIIIAIITSYISTKITYNTEIRKKIYDEREKTYIELFEYVEKLNEDPFLVFNNSEFLIPYSKIKSKLNLYASEEILNIIIPFNEKISNISNNYFDMFSSIDAQETNKGRMEFEEMTELELEQEEKLYMENNVIDKAYIDEVFSKLVSQVREELKTK